MPRLSLQPPRATGGAHRDAGKAVHTGHAHRRAGEVAWVVHGTLAVFALAKPGWAHSPISPRFPLSPPRRDPLPPSNCRSEAKIADPRHRRTVSSQWPGGASPKAGRTRAWWAYS